jgi:hypothetical protein
MYEVSFPKLSDRYFKQGPWPPVDAISDLVDQDHVFCLLYKVRQQQHAGQPHGASSNRSDSSSSSNTKWHYNGRLPSAAQKCWVHAGAAVAYAGAQHV